MDTTQLTDAFGSLVAEEREQIVFGILLADIVAITGQKPEQ